MIKLILSKGNLTGALVTFGIIIGIQLVIALGLDASSVTYEGELMPLRLEKDGYNVRVVFNHEGQEVFSTEPEIIIRYAEDKNALIPCTVSKTGKVTILKPEK